METGADEVGADGCDDDAADAAGCVAPLVATGAATGFLRSSTIR